MRRLRIIGLCCLVTLMFSGCGSSVASSLSDNEEIKAAHDRVPFTIILPKYLPDGYTFSEIRVGTPPSAVTNGRYSVLLIFTNDNNGYLEIEQSNYEIKMDTGNDVEAIDLSEATTADFFVAELANGKTARCLANFTVNGVGVLVMATDLSKSKMIRVAESLFED